MILLTGATGTTGQETVRQLLEKAVPFRVMTRDIARAKTVLGPDLDYVQGDFAQPETLAAAFDGIKRLSLLCAFADKMVALELGAVAAAKRAGICHIVKISVIGAAPDAPTMIRRWHGEIERRIDELRAVRRTLLDLAHKCHGDERPDCPIIDDLAAADLGGELGQFGV